MQVSVETTTGLGRRMKVQIPADQIDQQVNNKLQELTRSVRIDGFRPGKVPLSVVNKRYGTQVREEAASDLIASSYQEALQQQALTPASEPRIEQTSNAPGEAFEYVATFEIYPTIEVPELSNLAIEKQVCEVKDANLAKMMEKLRKQRATWNVVERKSASGDQLLIDFEGTVDGQTFSGNKASNVPLELGSNSMIPGFEEQLLDASASEQKTIEVTFPEDYASSEVAGKTAQFDIKIHSVSESVLPELDDNLATAFGMSGGLDTFKQEVRNNMQRELDATIKANTKQQVFDGLLGQVDLDLPVSLVDGEIDALIKSQDEGAEKQSNDRSLYEEEARRRVSLGLLISEIVKQNQLQPDPDKIRQTIEGIAASYEKPEEVVQWYYSNQEMLQGIQTFVMEDTVVDWVLEQSKTEDKSVDFDDIMQS
ncbi:MAG: trigger factor [Gammaproteobacteria bacterium]